jgi:hypothetical protein
METETSRRRIVEAAALTAFAVVFVLGLRASFSAPISPQDEGQLLVYPLQILHGRVIYRDFESIYGPGNPMLLAAVFRVLGATITIERTVGLVYRAVLVLAVYRVTKRASASIGWSLLAAAITAGTISRTGTAAYGWFGGLAAASLAVSLLPTARPRQAFAAGVLGGIALLFRIDLVIAVGIAAVLLGAQGRLTRSTLYGFCVPAAAGVAHALIAGPGTVFRELVIVPMRNGPGRTLPLRASTEVGMLLLGVLGVVAFLGLTAWRVRRSQPTVAAAAALSAGTVAQMLQRADYPHIAYVGGLALGLAVPAGIAWSSSLRWDRRLVLVPAALVLIASWSPRLYYPKQFFQSGTAKLLTNAGRTLPLTAAERDDYESAIRAADRIGEPGDRVIIGPRDLRISVYADTALYYLLPSFRPATYFLEFNPDGANHGSRLAHDLEKADMLLLTNRWINRFDEPNRGESPGSPLAGEVLAREFCERDRAGTFVIYRRCSP